MQQPSERLEIALGVAADWSQYFGLVNPSTRNLSALQGLADVAVIGIPDRSAGERVCAVVVAASVHGVSLESLVQHCRSRGLSRYKYPERLEIVDALPRNQFGKVIKKDLRETFG